MKGVGKIETQLSSLCMYKTFDTSKVVDLTMRNVFTRVQLVVCHIACFHKLIGTKPHVILVYLFGFSAFVRFCVCVRQCACVCVCSRYSCPTFKAIEEGGKSFPSRGCFLLYSMVENAFES